jgi:hypothetical protein
MNCEHTNVSGPGHTTGHCSEEATTRLEVFATEPTRLIVSGFFCKRHAQQRAEAALAVGNHPQLGNI